MSRAQSNEPAGELLTKPSSSLVVRVESEETSRTAAVQRSDRRDIHEVTNAGRLEGYCSVFEMNLDRGNTEKLISQMGSRVFAFRTWEGRTLIQEAILQNQPHSVELLLKYARVLPVSVNLDWRDLLELAIAQRSHDCVNFVLKRLTERCTTLEETASILKDNWNRLLDEFPCLIEDYLCTDKFSIDMGQFAVPLSVFDGAAEKPVAVSIDSCFGWEATSNELREFWIANNQRVAAKTQRLSEVQITATSKVVCIEDITHIGPEGMLGKLLLSNVSVNVFKSDTLKHLVNWIWQELVSKRFFISSVLHVFASILFSVFASTYGFMSNWPDNYRLVIPQCAIGLVIVFRLCVLLLYMEPISELQKLSSWKRWCHWWCAWRLVNLFVPLGLFVHSLVSDHHTIFTAWLTSFECIRCWGWLLWYLQPFRATGPLVSMIQYVLWDMMSFVMLGLLVMVGFGFAFVVLFGDEFVSDDGENFNSPLRSFESLFYAALGDFDPDVFRSAPDGFISRWRTFLFDVFLFLGAVVLLSLLISILGDTYDRVKLTQDAELIKCRARIIRTCGSFAAEKSRNLKLESRGPFSFLRCRTSERSAKYFYFLVPADPNIKVKEPSWQGKLLELERMFNAIIKDTEKKASRDIKILGAQIKSLSESVTATTGLLEQLQEQMTEMKLQNDEAKVQIFQRLEQPESRISLNAQDDQS